MWRGRQHGRHRKNVTQEQAGGGARRRRRAHGIHRRRRSGHRRSVLGGRARRARRFRHGHAHQARRRPLRRKHLLRPLLRDLPQGGEQRRDHVPPVAAHPARHRQSAHRRAAEEEPQPVPAQAAHPAAGHDLRPEPRLRPRAVRLQRRQGRQVRREHRLREVFGQPLRRARPGHGLLRRQHRHRAVELRPALRAQRPVVRHDLRPLHPGRHQPRLRPDPRHHLHRPRLRQRAPPADRQARPVHRALARRQGRRHAGQRPGPGLRRLLGPRPHQQGHARRAPGPQHRRSAQLPSCQLGLVPGRL